jgi:hypothetical protein
MLGAGEVGVEPAAGVLAAQPCGELLVGLGHPQRHHSDGAKGAVDGDGIEVSGHGAVVEQAQRLGGRVKRKARESGFSSQMLMSIAALSLR